MAIERLNFADNAVIVSRDPRFLKRHLGVIINLWHNSNTYELLLPGDYTLTSTPRREQTTSNLLKVNQNGTAEFKHCTIHGEETYRIPYDIPMVILKEEIKGKPGKLKVVEIVRFVGGIV